MRSTHDYSALESPFRLSGDRVLLRPWETDDIPALFDAIMESKERLGPWMPWATNYSRVEHAREFVEGAIYDWKRRANLFVAVTDKFTGRILGGSGYNDPWWDVPAFEIGYWLRDGAEGFGYITEAVLVLTEFAFAKLGANRVDIKCDRRNLRSAAVPERLGWTREAILRNHQRNLDGSLRDTLVFAMIRDEWESRR